METISKKFLPTYLGERSDIFWLAFKTSLLSLVTLGIYRFWAKTRVRRYMWSAIKINGDPAEYTGTGLEKFFGFLIAVVVLAVYLGILQVLLSFAGYSLIGDLADPEADPLAFLQQLAITYTAFLALLPLIYFAQYRSRRYMLSRTRWRGLRMGMSQGAGGYTWRALLLLMVTILSLGLLLPFVTFTLSKFMTDRTWYGDAKFEQGGHWTKLYGAMKHFFIAGALIAIAVLSGVFEIVALAVIAGIAGYIWFFIAAVYYNVHSQRYLVSNQTLDGVIAFTARPEFGFVLGRYFLGGLLVSLIVSVALMPAGVILMAATLALENSGSVVAMFAGFGFTIVSYLIALTLGFAATMAFITQPIFGHYVTTTTVYNAEHLDTIRQRADDSIPDADGFADALDIGGAF